jgi:hypothetical protein
MSQLAIDWTRDCSLPVSGRSVQARHSSSTGAMRAVKDRGQLVVAYLNLLAIAGPRGMSDFEAAAALGRQVSSLCSTRNGLRKLVTPSGSFEATPFGTRRTRWTLAREVR